MLHNVRIVIEGVAPSAGLAAIFERATEMTPIDGNLTMEVTPNQSDGDS